MIVNFTLDKEADTALVQLGGKGFHRDLHRLCQIVSKENRHFTGKYWRIKYASQYAKECITRWPDFYHRHTDSMNQMSLPIYDADGVIVDGVFHPGDPDATGTPDGWPWSEVEAIVKDGVRHDTPPVQVPVAQPDGTPYKPQEYQWHKPMKP